MSLKEKRSSSTEGGPANEKVVINVGGIRHETYTNTLRNIPDTRLYWISENNTQLPEYDPNANEYFFDRHPTVFGQILNFYRTGKLHCPNDVCGPLFEEELAFWGIDELQVESCCWLNYKKHREAQANLDTIDGNDSDRDSLSDMDMTVYGLVANSIRNRNRSLWRKYQPKVWSTFEEPYSSRLAQAIAFTTLVLILTSVITFCLESVPYFQEESSPQYEALYIIEVICVAWFTIEFVMRLIFCPRKLQFFKKPMNWIDFGAILPFYLELFINESNIKTIVVLRVVRLIRVFRIFKLSRHSYGLQILGHTLKSSCSELFLLGFFLSIGVVIFSSIIYYAEKDLENTKFTTIPHSFWWAVVTMTTLGYGDMSPKSWEGKIVGSFCAVSGVLMIALPVPVIVSNFSLYYSHAKARLKLPKRKRPLIIGAANALKVAQSFVAPSSPKFPGPIVEGNVLDDDSDKDDLRGSNKSRRPSRLSVGSTPRGSPPPKRRYSNSPTTMVTPATPRNPLLNSTQKKGHGSLLAVPEAERIEIEMEEHVPSFKVFSDKENPSKSSTDVTSSESSPSGQIFASRGSAHNSGLSSGRNSLSTGGSDPDSAGSANDAKTPLSGRQRSASSAQSLSVDSSQGSPKQNPRGRMGRRGSLYVVGFTAKHWQNKALKKNKKTTAAQTDSGPRRASTSSTGRRGSNTSGKNESSAQRNIGVTSDSKSPSTSSQIDSKITNLTETEEITDLPESDAAGLTTNKLLENTRGRELSKLDRRRLPSEASRTTEAHRYKTVSPSSGRMPDYSNPGKVIQTSVSIESNDSSSKYSDDSLTVNDRHRQRRGSSPLIRQKAVFTFDIPDQFAQVDPTAGSLGHGGQRWKTSSARTPDDPVISLSPLIEHASERTDGVDSSMTKKMSTEGRRKSCLPTITTERCSSKKDYSKSYPKLNGYVNGSYHEDEEDSLSANRGLASGKLHPGSRENSMSSPLGQETYRNIEYTNYGQPYYTEAKSLGQYSKPSQRHVPSVSDSCLPSISEEQADIDLRTRRFDMHRLVAPAVLPRPQSLPNWPGDMIRPVLMQRPYSDLVYLKQREANPVPFRKFSLSEFEHLSSLADSVTPPLEVYQVPSSVINHRNQNQIVMSANHSNRMISEDDVQHPLNQRRQGRMLYVHVPQSEASGGEGSSNVKEKPRSRSNTSDRATSPFIFQKAESFSTPELHSLNLVDRDEFVPRRVDSNLSKSWYQSLESANKTRTIDGICVNGKHAFVDYSTHPSWSSQHYQTRNSPAESTAKAFYDASTHNHLEYLGDTSERDRNVLDDRSCGRFENSSSNILKNMTKTEDRNPNGSPKLERTDRQVIYNGHDVLQPRESRPNTAPVFNRQRARAIFVGDSGIDSVGSTSVTSITHSLDSEIEGSKDGRENAAGFGNFRIDILNPIHETDTESSETIQPENLVKDSRSSSSNYSKAKVQTTASHVVNILSNPDLYESSLV